jgi:hypothetical protein
MKRTLAAALIAAAFTANAAGPYDGVYQSNTNPQLFYSLHQNGSAKTKNPATDLIAGFPLLVWWVVRDSNTRPTD